MKVSKIVELTGKSKEEVAEALGVPMTKSYWMKSVDDATAQEYIVATGGRDVQEDEHKEPEGRPTASESIPEEAKLSRFWSPRRLHFLPSDSTMERGDILFDDWAYVAPSDSPEAKFLKSVIARDKIGIREIFNKPYGVPRVVAQFILYLESLIFTGLTRSEGASREGVRCVRAMLSTGEQDKMEPVDLNSPRQLVDAVADNKSMNVQAFGTGV